ncbi:hypothetical protein FCM35_KLT03226 [Carex littledalei]|uniref:Uncharacterized protein n=1 Tax=Carex littledalei TaxID=544730 RepID=A0A833QR53_9POAL|nr:hypothetical protein FCM35_KLT03226 [Carex littledalei]
MNRFSSIYLSPSAKPSQSPPPSSTFTNLLSPSFPPLLDLAPLSADFASSPPSPSSSQKIGGEIVSTLLLKAVQLYKEAKSASNTRARREDVGVDAKFSWGTSGSSLHEEIGEVFSRLLFSPRKKSC